MAKKKETEFAKLTRFTRDNGMSVGRNSPGDGVTRYRFFENPNVGNDYFSGSGMCTVLGLKKAWKYLQTGECPGSKKRGR
jgi:hypothetical protein